MALDPAHTAARTLALCAGNGRIARTVARALAPSQDAVRVIPARLASDSQTLAGIDELVLVPTFDRRATENQIGLAQKARAFGVERIHMISLAGADERSPVTLLRRVGALECAVLASGLPHTALRCTPFMQTIALFARRDEAGLALVGPFREARFPWLDAEDVGAVLAARVADREVQDLACQISGPDELDFEHIAALLASALREPVRYVDLCLPEAQGMLEGLGFTAGEVHVITEYWDYLVSGFVHAGCCSTAEKLLGRAPQTLARYFEHYAQERLAAA